MRHSFFLFLLCFVFVLGTTACGGDDDAVGGGGDCDQAIASAFSNEVNAVSNATIAFNDNPSTENCNALRSAYQNYLDALRNFNDNCNFSNTQQQELDDAIDDAQAELNNTPC